MLVPLTDVVLLTARLQLPLTQIPLTLLTKLLTLPFASNTGILFSSAAQLDVLAVLDGLINNLAHVPHVAV